MGHQETLRSLHERLVGDLSRREHPLAGEAQAPEQAQQGIRPAPRRGALAWEDSVGWRGRRSHAFVVEQRVILDEARVRALASSRTDIRGGTAPRRWVGVGKGRVPPRLSYTPTADRDFWCPTSVTRLRWSSCFQLGCSVNFRLSMTASPGQPIPMTYFAQIDSPKKGQSFSHPLPALRHCTPPSRGSS